MVHNGSCHLTSQNDQNLFACMQRQLGDFILEKE